MQSWLQPAATAVYLLLLSAACLLAAAAATTAVYLSSLPVLPDLRCITLTVMTRSFALEPDQMGDV